jgi:chorismate lyase / 3-hydroxybenzoate synthase
MEKTETRDSGARDRGEYLSAAALVEPALSVCYLAPGELSACDREFRNRILGVVAFGAAELPSASANSPFVCVGMPLPIVGGDPVFEVWSSSEPVIREDAGAIAGARDKAVLFGYLRVKEDNDLVSAAHLAYARIFDFIESHGYGHLLRVWNCFPRINDSTEGLERYRQFSVGRYAAFAERRRVPDNEVFPAACAVGSEDSPLVIYFLAARKTGQPVENPRQVSAYRYPPQYGPRSPIFSRAMLMQSKGAPLLFISGTASIVGHETFHVGNAAEQVQETVANLLALAKQASRAGPAPMTADPRLFLKVYLRRADCLPIIRDHLLRAFGHAARIIYLRADICRADLLLEVEGVCLDFPGSIGCFDNAG